MEYEFINGVEMNRNHPQTFQVPTDTEIGLLLPGDYVKVGIRYPDRPPGGMATAERFWVILTKLDGPVVTGTVANDLVMFPELNGKEITFKRYNILGYSIHRDNQMAKLN